MNRSSLLAFAIALVLPVVGVATQEQPAQNFERFFARAVELHQAGDILGAIDSYKAALEIAPTHVDVLSNLGAAYVRLGQFEDAIRFYQSALAVQPTSAAVRLNLALAYYKSARPNEAVPQLKRVVSAEPNAKNAYLVLADCYLQTGQDQEVVALLQPREQMFGGDLAYAYLLGTALVNVGSVSEGQRYIERIFATGDSAEGHLLMGIVHLVNQEYREAKTELRRAVQLNPALPTAYSMYGRALLVLGEQEEAEQAFHKELEHNVNDFEANLQLGRLRKDLQKFEDAAIYLERATTIRPKDLTARKLLASLRLQTGRAEEAVALLEAVVQESPDSIDAHVQLAIAYNRLKRTADAQRERETVDRLNAEAAAKQKGK